MSRNKLSSVLLVLVLALFVGAAAKTDRKRAGLNGRVKSVLTIAYSYSGPADRCSEGKRTIESFSAYSPDGNLIDFTDYNPDGSLHRRDVFSSGPSGARQSRVSYDIEGIAFEKQTFDPNNNGQLLSSDMYEPDGSVIWRTTWQYNDKGQCLGTRTHDSKGNLIWSQTFNPTGAMIEENEYKDGAVASKRLNTYDPDGKLLESVHYDAGGSPLDGPKDPARKQYGYDSTGHLVEETQFNANGSVLWRITYAYDKSGNPIERSLRDQGGVLRSHRTFAYEFDSAGNWITQKISEDYSDTCSHPMQALFRTITYY